MNNMKKLLSILILLVLFISCEEYDGSIVDINNTCIRTQTLTYNGHDYIVFKEGFGTFATMAVEHDPDCKTCEKKNDAK